MADEETALVVEEAPETPAEEAKERLEQTVDVSEPGPCVRHIKVTVPRTEVQRYFDKELGRMIKEAAVPGFRPGKTPRKLIERKFHKEAADQVKIALVSQSMEQLEDDKRFEPVSEPDLKADALVLPDDGDFVYEFNIEVKPEFTLPDFRDIEVKRPMYAVTDGDVDSEIENLRTRFAKQEDKSGAAEAGDLLLCDVRTMIAGASTADATDVRVRLEKTLLFNDGKIENFAESMIGVQENDSRKVAGTVSAEVDSTEHAGKPFEAEFLVRRVMQLALPELNEQFFKEFGVGDLGELRDWVRSLLERRVKQLQLDRTRREVVTKLLEKTKIELPPTLLRKQSDAVYRKRVVELSEAGYDEDQIRTEINSLRQNAMASTAYFMRERFLLEAIAEQEKLEATDEDFDNEIDALAEQFGESPRRVRARIEQDGLAAGLMTTLLERKTIEKVLQMCKASEDPQKLDLHRRTDTWSINLSAVPAPVADDAADAAAN